MFKPNTEDDVLASRETRRVVAGGLMLFAAGVRSEVTVEPVVYEHDGKSFSGYVYYQADHAKPRPGVLVVHEWWGLNDYAKRRAEMLARRGYVAFAADMYGDASSTTHPDEARAFMSAVTLNVENWRSRAERALAELRAHHAVDDERLAAIGYCFGGSTVLQLAYAGADVDAVVSFHGGLPVPSADDAAAVRARMLIEHGGADPFLPPGQLEDFTGALDEADVDYVLNVHPEALHSFTVRAADTDDLDGTAYSAEADRASWNAMLDLFDEVFDDDQTSE